ncbi:MAG: hypothetical protein Kow0089_00110 [Desulfobulbaceae bacterium]
MFRPQAADTSEFVRRGLNLVVRARPDSAPRLGAGRRRKPSVDAEQRSLRLRKRSRRMLPWLLGPFVVLLLLWSGFNLLARSDIFRLTEVEVAGNRTVDKEQILKSSGLRRGVNLLRLDPGQIGARIAADPWIEDVQVKRRWPSSVQIIVTEYKPFALVNLERDGVRQLYYMDRKGTVFAVAAAERDLDYPVVNGAGLVDDMDGKRLRGGTLGAAALEFLRLTASGNQVLPAQAVSEIGVDPEDGLTVYLVDHPFPIYMGKSDIRTRFRRLVKVLARLYKTDEIHDVTAIRMDYGENKILVTRKRKGE